MQAKGSTADLRELSDAFKALSNPNRLAMYLELLRSAELKMASCPLADLVDRLDIGAPTVSHHTKELANAGLIDVERDGKFVRCRLNEDMRQRLAGFLTGVTPA